MDKMSPKIKKLNFYGKNPKKQRTSTPEKTTQDTQCSQDTEATQSTQGTYFGLDVEENSQRFTPSEDEEEITDTGNGQESQVLTRKLRYKKIKIEPAEKSRKGKPEPQKYKKIIAPLQRVSSIESLASLKNTSSDPETQDQGSQATFNEINEIASSQPDQDSMIKELQEVRTKNIKRETRISHGQIRDFEFTGEDIDRFVLFVKDHPFLYDRRHSDWSNNQLRGDKWLQLAKGYKGCHPDQCRKLYEKKRTAITKLKRAKYKSGIPYKKLTTKEQELVDVWGFLLQYSANTAHSRDNDFADEGGIRKGSESPIEIDVTSNSENENENETNITPASGISGTHRKVKTTQKKKPQDSISLMEKIVDRIVDIEGTASPTKLYKYQEPKDSREALRHHTLGMLRSVLANMSEEDEQTAAVKLINYCCELNTEYKEKKARKNRSPTTRLSPENPTPAPAPVVVAGTSTYNAPTCVTFSIPTTVSGGVGVPGAIPAISGAGGVPGAFPASVPGPSQQQISPVVYTQQVQNQSRISYLQAELLKEQTKVQPTNYVLDISNSSVGNTSTAYSNPITTIAGTQPFAVTSDMYRTPSITSISELYNLSPMVPLTTTTTKTTDMEINTPTSFH